MVDQRVIFDFGDNVPGSVLQRRENSFSDEWEDYEVDRKQVVNPFDVETLPPGFYRLREK
jgi:hypothetical protein